jgi:hypothetical protein
MKISQNNTCLVDLSSGLRGLQSTEDISLSSMKTKNKSCCHTIAGYGKCSACSCPGFFGSGYTCSRGGCGHHYDQH